MEELTEIHLSDTKYELKRCWKSDTGLKGIDFREVYFRRNAINKRIYGVIPKEGNLYFSFFARLEDNYVVNETDVNIIYTVDELEKFLKDFE